MSVTECKGCHESLAPGRPDTESRGPDPQEILGDIPPEKYLAATDVIGKVKWLAEVCAEHDPVDVAEGMKNHEIGEVREQILAIQVWFARFLKQIEGRGEE